MIKNTKMIYHVTTIEIKWVITRKTLLWKYWKGTTSDPSFKSLSWFRKTFRWWFTKLPEQLETHMNNKKGKNLLYKESQKALMEMSND